MRIWLDSGRSDREVLDGMDRLVGTLRADHMTVQQKTRAGGHTYSVWRPALSDSLGWALRQLRAGNPSA